MMNKKGQTLGITMIIAITIFIVGMMSINYIKPAVTEARDASHLNCSGDVSDGTKLTCLAVDIVVPYFIITIFSVAGGVIIARFLL